MTQRGRGALAPTRRLDENDRALLYARGRALLLLIGTLFVSWTAWTTLVLPHVEPAVGAWGEVRGLFVRTLLWFLPCGIYLWSQHGRFWWHPLRLRLPPNKPRWAVAVVITAMAVGAVSLNVARELQVTPIEVWRRLFTVHSFAFPDAPLFEELVFRGVVFSELLWLLAAQADLAQGSDADRGLRVWRAAWSANVAATIVFVGIHWPYWIYADGLGAGLLLKSLPIALLSLVLGMLFARSSSIWPCVAVHWFNNELSALLPR